MATKQREIIVLMGELEKIISKKLVEIIEKNSLWDLAIYSTLFVLFCMGSGAVVFWLWQRHKIKAETNKILKETEKISLELIEKKLSFIKEIKPYKEKYRKYFELLTLSLRSMIESVENQNIQVLNENREETIRIFCSDLMPTFVDYIEITMAINNNSEKKFFIANEVFPFFQLINNFVCTVNMPFIIDLVQKSKMSIHNETLISLFHIIEPNLSIWWIKHRYTYHLFKKKLQIAQQVAQADADTHRFHQPGSGGAA